MVPVLRCRCRVGRNAAAVRFPNRTRSQVRRREALRVFLSLSGWLVLGLLVAGGVVWQAPMRAVRYTLIVASTEHEFSSRCCRVVNPDLPDAKRHRTAAAALSGRFFVAGNQLSRARLALGSVEQCENWGLRNTQRHRILATPKYKRIQFAEGIPSVLLLSPHSTLRDADFEKGIDFWWGCW